MKQYHILTLLLLLAVACNRFDAVDKVFDNSAYLDVSAFDRIQPATFSNTIQTATKELSVTLAYPADKDITATVDVDASLVSEYNSRYGTDYQLLPAQYLDFEAATVTIEAGKVNSEKISIGFKNLMGEGEKQDGAMEIDKTWLLPVCLKSDDIDISTIMGVEQYLLLRIGDANFERQQLQFDGSGHGTQFGKLPSKSDASKKLSTGQWYHVAATYDQATRIARIYLNGKLLDEAKDVGVTGTSEDNRIRLAPREKVDGKGDTVTDYSRYKNHGKFGAKEQFEITTGVTVDPKEPEWATNVEIPELNK